MRAARRTVVLLATVLLGAVLAACGGTADTAGEGTVTPLGQASTPVRTLDGSQVAAVLEGNKAAFRAAAKAFHTCDRKVSGDRAGAYPCLKKVQAETAVVNLMVNRLAQAEVPPGDAAKVTNLQRLAAAGRLVNNKCSKTADQVCDQALARFRADQQSLLWDLQLTI